MNINKQIIQIRPILQLTNLSIDFKHISLVENL